MSVIEVRMDGKDVAPPMGAQVVPLLVSNELAVDLFKEPEPLSGCGAAVQFVELESGLIEMQITRGDPDCE